MFDFLMRRVHVPCGKTVKLWVSEDFFLLIGKRMLSNRFIYNSKFLTRVGLVLGMILHKKRGIDVSPQNWDWLHKKSGIGVSPQKWDWYAGDDLWDSGIGRWA